MTLFSVWPIKCYSRIAGLKLYDNIFYFKPTSVNFSWYVCFYSNFIFPRGGQWLKWDYFGVGFLANASTMFNNEIAFSLVRHYTFRLECPI